MVIGQDGMHRHEGMDIQAETSHDGYTILRMDRDLLIDTQMGWFFVTYWKIRKVSLTGPCKCSGQVFLRTYHTDSIKLLKIKEKQVILINLKN